MRAAPSKTTGWSRLRAVDCLVPAALLIWLLSLSRVNLSAIDDYGLLGALPPTFFVALGLLTLSIVVTLRSDQPSSLRLGLHVVALVLVLHGTLPLLLPIPNYPWTYKHIGVTDYIALHGSVRSSVDIYQNWPGFFAAAAWFTKLAGVGSPLAYAAWAPVYFDLLTCLMLGFAYQSLPVKPSTRWLAVFLFVPANWVGQDYFSPQALAFVLGLAVLGMVLTWLRAEHTPSGIAGVCRLGHRLVGAARPAAHGRLARTHRPTYRLDRAEPSRTRPAPLLLGARPQSSYVSSSRLASSSSLTMLVPRLGADPIGRPVRGEAFARAAERRDKRVGRVGGARLLALFVVFGAVVVTHQLSPYMLLLGVAGLTIAGKIRPRWVAVALTLEAVAYLVPNLSFLQRTQDLFGSVLNPFGNVGLDQAGQSTPVAAHRLVSLAAPALVLGLWALAAMGAVRRLRMRQPTLILALLSAAPVLLAVVQNYGGEAVLRIYLFSLPWTVLLAASMVQARVRPWTSAGAARVAGVLAVVVVLFMSAFYGSEELYRVQPGALRASEFFYGHATARSVLILGSPQFPVSATAGYDRFVSATTNPTLVADRALLHRRLGRADVPAVSALAASSAAGHDVYLVLTSDQDTYARVLGLLPAGALSSLGRALAEDSGWRVFYANADATIYRYRGAGAPDARARHQPLRRAHAGTVRRRHAPSATSAATPRSRFGRPGGELGLPPLGGLTGALDGSTGVTDPHPESTPTRAVRPRAVGDPRRAGQPPPRALRSRA